MPFIPRPEEVTRPRMGQAPYIVAQLEDGHAVEGRARGWTKSRVLVNWVDARGQHQDAWLTASKVRRISRDEARCQDPYDDFAFFYPQDA